MGMVKIMVLTMFHVYVNTNYLVVSKDEESNGNL